MDDVPGRFSRRKDSAGQWSPASMPSPVVARARRRSGDPADMQERLIAPDSQPSRVAVMEWIALNLTHELSQPLAAIANYVRAGQRLLIDQEAPDLERLAAALDGAMTQSLHAGRIISGLRAFATRGEADKQIESIADIVQRAVSVALPDDEARGVRLSLALDPSAGRVLVDRLQIEQVLVNLISNAVEAMRGCPHRHLSIASRREEGAVQISVTDTGTGLAAAVTERLFEPFVTTRRNGTGLGLPICRAIVEAHGGTLSCESAPEGGSIFRFTVTGVADALA
jgi:two-component system sensor kinase FixL